MQLCQHFWAGYILDLFLFGHKLKSFLRVAALVSLIILAFIGVELSGGVHVMPTNKRENEQINVGLVEKDEENEQQATQEIKKS